MDGQVMSDTAINLITLVVLVGVSGYLIASLVASILAERRRSHVRKTWSNFGLSLAFCSLFLLSWAAQGLAEWSLYRDEQLTHREPVSASGFLAEFGQSTLENWQSEFLQLFAFVVLSAVLIHRGSAESKDSDERLERKIDAIAARLDELGSSTPKPRRSPVVVSAQQGFRSCSLGIDPPAVADLKGSENPETGADGVTHPLPTAGQVRGPGGKGAPSNGRPLPP